jgi:hypothetical protein
MSVCGNGPSDREGALNRRITLPRMAGSLPMTPVGLTEHRYGSVVKSGKGSAQERLYSHCATVIADHELREQDLSPAFVRNRDISVVHAAHRFGTLQMVPEPLEQGAGNPS